MPNKTAKDKYSSVPFSELSTIYDVAEDILQNLPPSAVEELFQGSGKDLDDVMGLFFYDINSVLNNEASKLSEYSGLDNFAAAFDDSLKIQSYNYFKTTMLPNFNQGWRNLEWGNLVQLHQWSAYLCQRGSGKSYEFTYALPLWRMYRYRKPNTFIKDSWDNKNSKETVIITNESRLGKKHLEKVVSEIDSNDLLGEKLRPDGGVKGIEKFVAKNGALIELRSFGSFIRGLHVGMVIVDDFLDKSAIYSHEQREKFKEVFYAEIKNIVEPYGYLIVSGTPFSKNDLYNDLKQDPMFKVFEYPGVYIDGKLLAPDRFNFKQLMELRKSLGSIVFAREILVTPIDDASSIFPWDFLRRSLTGMEKYNLVENIESFPIKLDRVVVGCDFAISGNIGADYSVFSVWGIDKNKHYYLLHIWRKQGASHNEQVSQIVRINNVFKPNVIVCEKNNIGAVLIPLIQERGVHNVKEFVTGINKRDLYQGLPSLSAMFERGDIKIPYGNEKTKNTADWLCGEFNSIGFDEDKGKLESMDGHDDGVMSSWFALSELREGSGAFKVSYI